MLSYKINTVVINVVNRHPSKSIEAVIENQYGILDKKGKAYEIYSTNLKDENSVTEQKVKTTEKLIDVTDKYINYIFPAHSFTQLIFKIK